MKNLIVVTSVINISKNPLDYTNTRSVYSTEERYEQTLQTIESLNKIKNKKILFVETSEISEDMEKEIINSVDFYFNFYSNPEIKDKIDGRHKGIAEGTQIFEALKKVNIWDYENVIKISGRYYLDENFNYLNYDNDLNIFKEGPNKSALGTVLYKINKKDFSLYEEAINFCRNSSEMLEKNFVIFFKNRYITYSKIGVSGYVSVDGNKINW